MASENQRRLSDTPIVVIIGVLAAIATIIGGCITACVFVTGREYLRDILRPEPTSADTQPMRAEPKQDCIRPETLAQQKGWIGLELVDEYGGYRVRLDQPDQLPSMWEANGERLILQLDPDRRMSAGLWIIYTPYDCRGQFGFAPAVQTVVECIHPETLASQRGWTALGLVDKYGGYQVRLGQSDQLPPLWEANGARAILQLDSDRELTPGVWIIYTPYSCRDEFGFDK